MYKERYYNVKTHFKPGYFDVFLIKVFIDYGLPWPIQGQETPCFYRNVLWIYGKFHWGLLKWCSETGVQYLHLEIKEEFNGLERNYTLITSQTEFQNTETNCMNMLKDRVKILTQRQFWIIAQEEKGMSEDLWKDEITKGDFMWREQTKKGRGLILDDLIMEQFVTMFTNSGLWITSGAISIPFTSSKSPICLQT